MRPRSIPKPRIAVAMAVSVAVASRCTPLLEHVTYRDTTDAAVPTPVDGAAVDATNDAPSRDVATEVTPPDGSGTDADAPVDATALDAGPLDAVTMRDVVSGEPARDIVTRDTNSSLDGAVVFMGSASTSCSGSDFHPNANFSGTTCDSTNALTLSCNPGDHPEIIVRIDGRTGERYQITVPAGFAVGTFFGTACDRSSPMTCGSGALDGGTIGLGPYPSDRTDYIVFETVADTPCGPYDISVRRL